LFRPRFSKSRPIRVLRLSLIIPLDIFFIGAEKWAVFFPWFKSTITNWKTWVERFAGFLA